MTRTIEEARAEGERRIGRRLSDAEFEQLYEYACHKADCQGNGADYVPFLLPDVISENEYSNCTLKMCRELRLLEAELAHQDSKEVEEWKQLCELSSILGVSRHMVASALSASRLSLRTIFATN